MFNIFNNCKSYVAQHKAACALALGVIIAIGLKSFGGRLISWLSQGNGTTKKTDDLGTKTLKDTKSSLEENRKLEEQVNKKDDIQSKMNAKHQTKINEVVKLCEEKYWFSGFSVNYLKQGDQALSCNSLDLMTKMQMICTKNVFVNGVGKVYNCYSWQACPPDTNQESIKASVRLPEDMTVEGFADMRRLAQQAVITKKGLDSVQAQELALKLGGIVIEATLNCRARFLLGGDQPDVSLHYIFQTGLNFTGVDGGGIPLTNLQKGVKEIKDYYHRTAQAAVESSLVNQSNVLVFNAGIGTGYFGGDYVDFVKQANVDAICSAYTQAKRDRRNLKIMVPNVEFLDKQIDQLNNAGIQIFKADKDAVSALLAKEGFKVSLTVAADPMSTLGIHGPGFWWETVGSDSDEERAAFLTNCYLLGHIPINVYPKGAQATRINALSEFMRPLE